MPLQVGAWYPTWSDWNQSLIPFDPKLSDLLDVVAIFVGKPDMSYTSGQNSWSGTGVEFSDYNNFGNVKADVAAMRAKGTKVLLAIGGATYNNWSTFNVQAINALVTDLGLNGVELDFELYAAQANLCTNAVAQCLNYPWETWLCAMHVGAYDGTQQPTGSGWQGVNLPAIQQFGSRLAGVNIMAYNGGPTYDPKVAYAQFRKYCPNVQINVGVMVAPEDWGGHVWDEAAVKDICNFIKNDKAGIFVFDLHRKTSAYDAKAIIATVRALSGPAPAPPSQSTTTPPSNNQSTQTSAPALANQKLYLEVYDPWTGQKEKLFLKYE
jgi:hypothetical protein